MPEYNLDIDVKHITRTEATKEKIRNTLNTKYSSGYTNAYSNTEPVFVYNICSWKFCGEFEHLSKVSNILYGKSGTLKRSQVGTSVIKDVYFVSFKKYESLESLVNEVSQYVLTYKTNDGTLSYLIVEDNSGIRYFKTIQKLIDCINVSSVSTLKKHSNATIENPYIIPNTSYKVYRSSTFIPVKSRAVPVEESLELLSGNIGEGSEKGNAEINSESKESESSYRVENEPTM